MRGPAKSQQGDGRQDSDDNTPGVQVVEARLIKMMAMQQAPAASILTALPGSASDGS